MPIVCGTDFSDNATRASRAAAAIARRRRTALVLVHVADMFETEGELPLAHAASHARLRARATELATEYGIEVEPLIKTGVPYEALIEVAKERAARLIVVAFLGTSMQARWSIGSVAERVAQTAPIATLVVRECESIEAWTLEEQPLRVMVGVEMAATAKAALKAAVALRDIAPCDLLVAQIAWPVAEHARLGIPSPIPLDRLRPELYELLLRDLRAWAGELPGPGENTLLVSPGWGRVDHHLVSLSTSKNASLLVVGTHQRSGTARLWQGSVSRGVLEQAQCNVLCVPRDPSADDESDIANFHRVLVPTDFSRLSNRAIRVAYGMVAPMGVVHLVHVSSKKSKEEDAAFETQLRALIPEGAAARGIVTEVEVVHEKEAAVGICQVAERQAVDAICMASHGRSGVSQLLSGSQTQAVVKRSRMPVVIVPPLRE
jgi:nucleotide-binding universal stress UspA family protein